MRTMLLAAMLLFSLTVIGEGRRRAVASPLLPDLTLTFVDVTAGSGSEAAIDTGAMAWRRDGPRRDVTITTRTFGLRIDRRTGDARGTAIVRASLESSDPRCKIRVDGIELGTAPRLIDANAPIGTVMTHRIELEVPVTVPAGAFHSAIHWEVTTP